MCHNSHDHFRCRIHGLSSEELVRLHEDEGELGGYFLIKGIERCIRLLQVGWIANILLALCVLTTIYIAHRCSAATTPWRLSAATIATEERTTVTRVGLMLMCIYLFHVYDMCVNTCTKRYK
ncbi:hypothetical protein EON65_25790 [archaeon]|nr:MAG: hypothetical protein EON65_25790 [archaeon]